MHLEKKYRRYDPDQSFLIALNPRDWLAPDHLCFFVEELVDGLDLADIYASYKPGQGQPPFEPGMMTKILFYAYSQNVRSSRQIEKRLNEDIAFRILAAGNQVDHVTVSRFRKRHLEALAGLFAQILVRCIQEGLVTNKHIALDGTKIKANASRHKAMSYKRLKKEEKRLEAEIKKHLQEAVREDEDDDERDAPVPNRLGPDFDSKLKRLEKVKAFRAQLEERARREGRDSPRENEQINFTDPESRIAPVSSNKKAFEQAYNAQTAVDSKARVIVATQLTNRVPDMNHLPAMMDEVEANLCELPEIWSSDAGYYKASHVRALEGRGVRALIPPDRQKHGDRPVSPRGRIPADLSDSDRMRRLLRTKSGREGYRQRKAIAEPPFGLIKRVLGFRQMSMRGLENAKGEWGFVAGVYNAMVMYWTSQKTVA